MPRRFASFPWAVLPSLAGDLLAVMFVTTISLLLNTTGDRDRDASAKPTSSASSRRLALANLLSAALGGYVSCLSVSRTTLGHVAGATGRLAGLTVAAISAALLVVDPGFLGYVPKYALGGLLFYLGARLVYRWLVHSARQLLLIEYLSLIAIALIIIKWGFIAGVLIGIVIGCATFALSASRVNAIKFSFDGSEYRSSLDRGRDELAILAAHGREIQGMALQSYLFFGSPTGSISTSRRVLGAAAGLPLPAFRFPPGDRHRFVRNAQLHADQRGRRRIRRQARPGQSLAGAGARIPHRAIHLRRDIIVVTDLDRALESCEEDVIEAHSGPTAAKRNRCAPWLAEALGSAELRRALGRAGAGGSRSRPATPSPGRAMPADVDAFHPRGPRRHCRRSSARPLDPRPQPRPAHHHR